MQPSGQVTRVTCHTITTGEIDGIPVTEIEYGEVEGLPEPEENTIYSIRTGSAKM